MDSQFVINERFKINEAVNTVTDMETSIETRLEPRLMRLIILLASYNGEVVTRQQIITDIWDDYGNADEGLNQAISSLRKVFADADKQLIRTISKKGYILNARVSTNIMEQPVPSRSPSRTTVKLYVIILLFIVIVVASIYFIVFQSTPRTQIEPPGTDIDTVFQYQEMKDSMSQKTGEK